MKTRKTTRKTAKKPAAKKAASKKAARKKAASRKAANKKAASKKAVSKKLTGKKAAGGKAASKKVTAKKPSARKSKKPGQLAPIRLKPITTGQPDLASVNGDNYRAKVRMYRQGLGDCFLITLPRQEGTPFYAVIDCGVILGTHDPKTIMEEVVQNIIDTTGGHLDLVVATHEHWDHISGFVQAGDLWKDSNKLQVDQVWLAWTEDSKDALAKKLRGDQQALRAALALSATRLRLGGDDRTAEEVTGLLEFFGATGGSTTSDALDVVKNLTKNIRFCLPKDEPVTLDGTGVKVYVLGPPHDEKLIKKYNPSKKEPETYGIDAMNMFMSGTASALSDETDHNAPFDPTFQIPLPAAEQMPFYQSHYWGEDADAREKNQSWRRIDGSWLDSSSALALQLDSATNNTCLVLAFELEEGGDVLLFAADAQVGNWLSWQDLTWEVEGNTVTGPDLLHRTIFYKVGHHGSHNATLREKGLEEMTELKLAFVPVDHQMALKKRWGQMPLNQLMDRLNEITKQSVIRIDEDVPAHLTNHIESDKLFHEVLL
jgi:hypothetical protein